MENVPILLNQLNGYNFISKIHSFLSIKPTIQYFIGSFLYDLLLESRDYFCDEKFSLLMGLGRKFYFVLVNFWTNFYSFFMIIWD